MSSKEKNQDKLVEMVRAIIDGKTSVVRALLVEQPSLAQAACTYGAARQNAEEFFFPEIRHYMYGGDTALHMAAAAYNLEAAEMLLDSGADVAALNRLKAQPIHYACDGLTTTAVEAQEKMVTLLLKCGADPNAVDKLGAPCLHRAVRNRGIGAVRALLAGGANINFTNKNGSTPMNLAVRTTGKSGSGGADMRANQEMIIKLLLAHGAAPEP